MFYIYEKLKIYLIFLSFTTLLQACITEVRSPSNDMIYNLRHIETNKKIKNKTIGMSNAYNFKEIKEIISLINKNYYGSSEEVGIIIEENTEPNAIALPDDRILITTGFLNIIDKHFTYPEKVSFLCHESSHILNNDWGRKIREENSTSYITVNRKLSLRVATSSKLGYKIARQFNKDLTMKEYRNSIKEDFENYGNNEVQFDKYKIGEQNLDERKVDFGGLTDAQGFSLEKEFKADKSAIYCLKELGYSPSSLYLAIEKTIINPNIPADKDRMLKRLKKIKKTIGSLK